MAANEVEILKQKLQLLESENQRLRRQAASDEKTITTENDVQLRLLPITLPPLNSGIGGNIGVNAPIPLNPLPAVLPPLIPAVSIPPIYEGSSKIKIPGGIEVSITAKRATIIPTINRPTCSLLSPYDDYVSVYNKRTTLTIWCEVISSEDCNALIIVKPSLKANNGCEQFDFCFTDYLQLSSVPIFTPMRGSKEIRQNDDVYMQMQYSHGLTSNITNPDMNNLILTLKVIRLPLNIEDMAVNDSTVTVEVENEKIEVDAAYLSKWSSYFQGYFSSNMKEKATGIYPIIMCTANDFRELLQVIYPSSKPIDTGNVRRMLDIADKFIMPELTRKCEMYLCSSSSLNSIDLLEIADQFNLYFPKMTVLERMTSTDQLRLEIINAPTYNSLSNNMKRDVDGRYVQLDVDRTKKPRFSRYQL